MSSSSPESNVEPKKPLQFSLRFVLGVVTGVAVFCAIVKTGGEPFRMMMAAFLIPLSFVTAIGTVVCLVTLLAVAVLPDDPEKEGENLRQASRTLLRSIAWCIVPWLLLGLAALLRSH